MSTKTTARDSKSGVSAPEAFPWHTLKKTSNPDHWMVINCNDVNNGDCLLVKAGDIIPVPFIVSTRSPDFKVEEIDLLGEKQGQQVPAGSRVTAGKAEGSSAAKFQPVHFHELKKKSPKQKNQKELMDNLKQKNVIIRNPKIMIEDSIGKVTALIVGIRGILTESSLSVAWRYTSHELVNYEHFDQTEKEEPVKQLQKAIVQVQSSNKMREKMTVYQNASEDLLDTLDERINLALFKYTSSIQKVSSAVIHLEALEHLFGQSGIKEIEYTAIAEDNHVSIAIRSPFSFLAYVHPTHEFVKGQKVELTPETWTKLEKADKEMMDNATHFTFAYSQLTIPKDRNIDIQCLKDELCVIGLVGLEYKLATNASESIHHLKSKSGFRVILTSVSPLPIPKLVATKVGYLTGKPENYNQKNEEGEYVTEGSCIQMSNDLDDVILSKQLLFTSVTPKQKASLVDALQMRGDKVAVVSEGVDDTPALLKADVGFSFATSSDINKEASDFIVSDDFFPHLVYAIEVGHRRLGLHTSGGTPKPEREGCLLQ